MVWLFDLDNTLYPVQNGLMEVISERINRYIERHLNLPPSLAEGMREAYYGQYGSSIGGLFRHCQIDADEFLDYVHDVPLETYIKPNPRLDWLLTELPGHKYLFTNAPEEYARRTLQILGVERHFAGIFDIRFSDLEGKPAPHVYEKVLAALGRPAGECWLVEDSVINLLPARALGCHTVWLTPNGAMQPEYVEYVINDLDELPFLVREAIVPIQ